MSPSGTEHKRIKVIEIKHKETGVILLAVSGDSLRGANLIGANLIGANLNGVIGLKQ
jgi:hypothetical protein